MIPIGFKLKVDGSEFKQSMNSLKSDLLGMVALDKIKGGMDDLISRARTLNRMHKEYGIPQEQLQAQEFALKSQGKSLEDLEELYYRMNKARKEAIKNPGSEQAKIFDAIMGSGFSASGQLQNISADKLFNSMSKGLEQMGAAAKPYFAEIFGKSSYDMMAKFGPQFEKLQNDFLKMGLVLEQNTIVQLVEFGKTTARIRVTLESWVGRAVQWFANRSTEAGIAASGTQKNKTSIGKTMLRIATFDVGGIAGDLSSDLGTASLQRDIQDAQTKNAEFAAEAKKKAEEDEKFKRFLEQVNSTTSEKTNSKHIVDKTAIPSLSALQQIGAYAGTTTKAEQIATQQLQKTDMMAQAIDRLQRDVQSIRNSFNM